MKTRIKLAESKTREGGTLSLHQHDGAFSISFNGKELMHSKATASETLLGRLGIARLERGAANRILIGGLGLGFTLKSILKAMGPETRVEVAELVPAVIAWNRSHLQSLNGKLLDDPRVEIRTADVARLIRKAPPETYDAIVLDVDNGPVAMVAANNASLYSVPGIRSMREALKPGGRFVVWSAGPDAKFEARLNRMHLKFKAVPAKLYEQAKRDIYRLYVVEPPALKAHPL